MLVLSMLISTLAQPVGPVPVATASVAACASGCPAGGVCWPMQGGPICVPASMVELPPGGLRARTASSAAPGARFGAKGQWLVGGALSLSSSERGRTAELLLTVARFVLEDLAAGLTSGVSWQGSEGGDAIRVSAGGNVHLNLSLSDRVSLFPGGGLSLGYTSVSSSSISSTDMRVTGSLEVPLIIQVAEHVFLAVGPDATFLGLFGTSPRGQIYGLRGGLGIWL